MEEVLSFIPPGARSGVQELLIANSVEFKLTKVRRTKHGDFRWRPGETALITLNKTTNPYRFLITLLHELAHFQVSTNFSYRVKPHGKEWKKAYRALAIPFLNANIFPEPLCRLFAVHLKNPKASTDRDFALVSALKQYDPPTSTRAIFELAEGEKFQIEDGRTFIKIKKRRIRYECQEVRTGKCYLFSPQAEVYPLIATD